MASHNAFNPCPHSLLRPREMKPYRFFCPSEVPRPGDFSWTVYAMCDSYAGEGLHAASLLRSKLQAARSRYALRRALPCSEEERS